MFLLLACLGPPNDEKHDGGDDSGGGLLDTDSGGSETQYDVLLVADNTEDAADAVFGVALSAADWMDDTMRVAITTTSVNVADGASPEVDAGEAGSLVIGARSEAADVSTALICDTIAWRESEIPRDGAYTCGDAYSSLSIEYLDCVCGRGEWETEPGNGNEEGLEAATEAVCRAVSTMPGDCTADDSAISASDAGSNDFLREGAGLRIVVVTSEGDGSRRVSSGDNDGSLYADILGSLADDWGLSVVGPAYVDQDGSCLGGAQPWAVERYQWFADDNNGTYEDLTEIDADCTPKDIGAAMQAVVSHF